MSFDLAEGALASPTLELTCFGGAPLDVGAQSHFFPHISSGPFEDDLAFTGKASPGLCFLGSHGMGHFHL